MCIRPLLDEEKARAQLEGFQNQQQMFDPNTGLAIQMNPHGHHPHMPALNLPAALLDQYPVLASIDWDSGGQNDGDLSDAGGVSGPEWGDAASPAASDQGFHSNRSSFDASAYAAQTGQQIQVQGGQSPGIGVGQFYG